LLLGALLAGCAGGRGSSGFDINAENAAIVTALATRQCVEVDGLMICPANESAATPPAASPTPTASPTPLGPTPASPTPARATPTPTATASSPRVDITVSSAGPIACLQEPNGACRFSFAFTPSGFPPTANFRVAARDAVSNGPWQIGAVPIASDDSEAPSLVASLVVASVQGGPPRMIEFAVLIFPVFSQFLPLEVQTLSETGADFAFVTPPLSVAVIANPPSSEEAPQVTHFGVARSDHVPVAPVAFDEDGRPVYLRPIGSGMTLVVEARPGSSSARVGTEVFDPAGGLPDLQMIVSRPLGDGSAAVCDTTTPDIGGVPATDPLEFSDASTVVSAINDLGCRVDGARTKSGNACTVPNSVTEEFAFVVPSSTIQYCLPIDGPWAFAPGDTIVAARVRDVLGGTSEPQEIVIRVAPATAPPPQP
jgi:hypothetical protein